MDKDRVIYLHNKYLEDSFTPQEHQEWKAILIDPDLLKDVQKLMDMNWYSLKVEEELNIKGNRSEEIFDLIIGQPKQLGFKKTLWSRIAAVAAIILVIGISLYFYNQYANTLHYLDDKRDLVNDIKPGGNKAYLTLANGKRLSLTDVADGTIATERGVEITKTKDGQIIYSVSDIEGDKTDMTNIIETPKGGQYQVHLPDGSKVWLNAASKLIYPVSFKGRAQREVNLSGEAYFEITKDKAHPFRVKSAGQLVEVLGTHFNVNGYANEPTIVTTLIEGSVKVSSGKNKQLLKPGYQAINSGKTIKVAEANIDNIMDWKNGGFYLDGIDFKVAMRKIARWYNVDVVYDVSVSDDIETGGWISRDKSLLQVLKFMEKSGLVHFRVDGRKVYVSK